MLPIKSLNSIVAINIIPFFLSIGVLIFIQLWGGSNLTLGVCKSMISVSCIIHGATLLLSAKILLMNYKNTKQ